MKVSTTEIRKLEKRLIYAVIRRSPDELDSILADDFLEIGRSGRKYDKGQVIKSISQGGGAPAPTMSQFTVTELAAGLYLANYVSKNNVGTVASRRTSIWKKQGAKWRLLFHQGTPAAV